MGFLVDDLIKCPQCKEIFKSPVILPCAHSICKHHVDEVLKDISNDIENREIECLICKRFHQISESVVFIPNKVIESLIEKNMDKINLGEEYNSALDKCNIFGDLLETLNKIKNDPDMRINTVISELKNKVDLRREKMKEEIDEEALKMIDKLNEYEKECKLKMKLASDSKLNEKFEGWKNSLKQWHLGLNTFDSVNYKSVLDESTSQLKDLHSEFLNFDRSLFLNRLNQFKCPNVSASNNFITLKFEFKELSKYIDSKERKHFYSPCINIDGIDFGIKIEIVKLEDKDDSNKSDTYFGVFLRAKQVSFIRDVKIDYELVILDQLGLNKSIVEKASDIFKINSWGYARFIKLKDLIANNNLYNVQNDSCTVQAIVNSFEWI